MTKNMDVTFSINLYDSEGHIFEKGIYLHIEPNIILEFNDIAELKKFGEDILGMIPEIEETILHH